ncbi:MAG: GFA family protein [Alphaproteobacteria bacterium]|nr:MAG: GFA family protein [Alphaproteobacteria bacterium]
MSDHKTGSCLCGAVKFTVTGPLRAVIACHCRQCRKQTGNYMSATGAKDEYLKLTETRGLRWYRSSETAKRGFCNYTAIAAGAIDGPTGLKLAGHIFCDDAGDYYEITGGDYRLGQWAEVVEAPSGP